MIDLHFLRVREKGSSEPFIDPYADIKEVVSSFAKELPRLYKLSLNPPEEKVDLLKAYIKVCETRLLEDKTPLTEQMAAFEKSLKELFDTRELWFFAEVFTKYVLVTYALHMRRDGKVDAERRASFRMGSLLLTLAGLMSPDVWATAMNSIPEEISRHLNTAPEQAQEVMALCVEDPTQNISDIKTLAADAIGATGASTWEEVAAACDKYAEESINADDKTIAASLAYPSYKAPFFELTKEMKEDAK